MRYYPVFVDLQDQLCVVIGENQLAEAKGRDLRGAGASVRVIPAADYRDGDLAGARLVVDASGDPELNRRSWLEAEAAGILVNVVDVPDKCRFIAPAIVRRAPLLVAISTSGESPFLASMLRARIERILGPEWGPFTALVGKIRRGLRAAGVPLDRQLQTYKRLLASEVLADLRAGREEDARREAEIIASEARIERQGRVALVGAGPGDPGLLTLAAHELLWRADVVLHDALVSPETLAQAGPAAEIVDVGKRAGRANPAQEWITAEMIAYARKGLDVVRLKGGDPFVFGRGGEELADLIGAGIEVIVVPGVSSAIAGPAAAGIPLTHRDLAASIGIVAGRSARDGEGFESIVRLAGAVDTLVVLMPLAILAPLTEALSAVLPRDRPAAVIAGATTRQQQVVRAPLAQIAEAAAAGQVVAPALLVIGAVVDALPRRRLREFLRTVAPAGRSQ